MRICNQETGGMTKQNNLIYNDSAFAKQPSGYYRSDRWKKEEGTCNLAVFVFSTPKTAMLFPRTPTVAVPFISRTRVTKEI
jgi:hypothetical protein